jgi:hypothetical protein
MSEAEIQNFNQTIKTDGAKTLHLVLAAALIWLFGVLVFIPTAAEIGANAELVVTLIILAAFTTLDLKALPGTKNLIDAFAVFPARKYLVKKGIPKENAVAASKQLLYIAAIIIGYLLYFPFLARLHPALNGIALILVVITIFLLTIKTMRLSKTAILNWLTHDENTQH